ncbi:hypothetical protein [Limnohabitans sp. Rim28]|uniref:hypothetical protein n=1 Tax=Limnohabitans sp. Rim28 TaxID=1100720 RepID=UPI00036D3DB4|nr:hypothetical protein [Limnohabitans sp. Rim28]PVE05054.1 hypothetical protein B472_16400 [Limnohabitans sp. Rim28]
MQLISNSQIFITVKGKKGQIGWKFGEIGDLEINTFMKITEIIPTIPLTKPTKALKPLKPAELHAASVKKQADAAQDRLDVERQRKRLQRVQKAMSKLLGMGYS